MNTTYRIALIGQLGTGKSFVARRLANALDARVISFGQEVYKVAEEALGRKIDKKLPQDRRMLTDVGTHWGRNGESVDSWLEARLADVWPNPHGYENIWVDSLERSISELPADASLILDDLRFPNELQFLLDQGFCIFLLQCDLATRSDRLQMRGDPYATTVDDHPSEELATWLSRLSRTKTVVPSIWNDQPETAPTSGGELLITLLGLEVALREKSFDGILAFENNATAWRTTLESFKK